MQPPAVTAVSDVHPHVRGCFAYLSASAVDSRQQLVALSCSQALAHAHACLQSSPASLLFWYACLAVCSTSGTRVSSSGWWACTASHSTRSSRAAVPQRSQSDGASFWQDQGHHLPHTSPSTPHTAAQPAAVKVRAAAVMRRQHVQQQRSKELRSGVVVAEALLWGGRVRCSS
jgi:hypothetical protein